MRKFVASILGINSGAMAAVAFVLLSFAFLIIVSQTNAQKAESSRTDAKPGVVLSPEANVTISGGGSSSWDIYDSEITDNGLPSGGGCSSGAAGSGAAISDAGIPSHNDAFDQGGMIWVNNTQVGGAMTQVGNTVNFAPVTIAGLNTNMQYYIASNSATARIMVTLTNPTGSTITVPVNYATNAGSDSGTIIKASSNGNTTFETADRWVVSSDASDGDAVNTAVLFGPGSPAISPTSVSTTVFNCSSPNGFLANYTVSVPAGATRSLMFFQKLNNGTPTAISEAPTFFDTNPAINSDLLSGLNQTQLNQIANWAFAPPPPPICNTYIATTSAAQVIVPGTVDTGSHADDSITPVALPFPFVFYGNTYNAANLSSNGNIQFNSSNSAFTNQAIPTNAVTDLIAPFWDDLCTRGTPGVDCGATNPSNLGIFTSVSGSAPNRIFNIEWRAAYCCAATPATNFEARLYESGQIDFVYGNINGTGSSATVGVQKGDGSGPASTYTQFSFNQASLSNGMGITFGCSGVSTVKVADTIVTPGQIVSVPIILNSTGNEKSVAFSLAYDTNPFGPTPTATCGSSDPGCTVTVNNSTPGVVGVTVTNSGVFNAGQREVARVNFQSLPTPQTSSVLNIADSPVPRRVADAGNATLPSVFLGGTVVFSKGIEGDIAPRNTGNGVVDSGDVTVERLFVTGSATPDPTFNETQRADVSPASTGGDGVLDATDLTKLRRYATNLDIAPAAAGPNGPIPPVLGVRPDPVDENASSSNRTMRIVSTDAAPGAKATVYIDLDQIGNETAASFTLDFDAATLRNPIVEMGDGASGDTVLSSNVNRAGEGKVSILIDSSKSLAMSRLAKVTFDVSPTAKEGAAPISFSSSLTRRSISDAEGNQLSSMFVDGAVNVSGPAQSVFSISGRVTSPDGRGLRNATITIVDRAGNARTTTTSSFGYYTFDGVAAGSSFTASVASRQYRFAPRTIQVTDNLSDVDFVGQE